MDPFAAVADPVRRRIVELLAEAPRPAGRLAEAFERISRPAVSRHLRVLREAGLVDADLVGRERIYRVTPGPLDAVRVWLDEVHPIPTAASPLDHLAGRLDALDTEVRRTRRDRRDDGHEHASTPRPTADQTDPTQERTA